MLKIVMLYNHFYTNLFRNAHTQTDMAKISLMFQATQKKIFHPTQQAMHEAGVSKPSRITHCEDA